MANYKKVLLMGRLTRDIELRHTPSNQAVANIGLAVNHYYTTRDGEKREDTAFVDCEAWGRQAEVMSQYLSKGRPVFVEGRLKLDQWQDKDGGNRSKLKVVIEDFQFIDSRGDGEGAPARAAAGASAGASAPAPSGGGGGHQPINEDDIPF
jgi:single-strand DNA-binding protein